MNFDFGQTERFSSGLRQGRGPDRLVLALLSAFGLCLALFTLTLGGSASSFNGDSNWLRLEWIGVTARPSPQSIMDAVEKAHTGTTFAQAESEAKRALAAQPLDTVGLQALMNSAAKQQNFLRADTLAKLIVGRDARATQAQLWLFGREAARGDYVESLTHADLALRANPELRTLVLPWLVALTVDERAIGPLATLLADSPSWRGWFLEYLADDSKIDGRAVSAVFQALQNTNRPPTEDEIRPYLLKLINKQQYAKAYVLWLQALPPEALTQVTLLYDHGFKGLPGAPPFNWVLSKANGGYGEFAVSPEDGRRALHVGYGGNASISLARQLVLLAPGRYELKGRYAPDGENSPGQFRIAVTCMPLKSDTPLTNAQQIIQGDFVLLFAVPENGCSAQELEILGAPTADSKPASAWYEHLQLSPAN